MSQVYPESDMAEKINNENGINETAIDEDSSEILVKDNKTTIHKTQYIKKRKKQFSENIFFYSYPFPFRYIKKAILSRKDNQEA
ncbi:MAG: hypothetical protein ACFFDI_29315 [Promethearchaeota archaeon]